VGGPGDAVPITVSIATSGLAVAATANDITFSTRSLGLNPATCRANPAIQKSVQATLLSTDANTTTLRILVQADANVDPIPDGALYTCTARIPVTTLPATYRLSSDIALAFAPDGTAFEHVVAADGMVIVSLVGGLCVGDCTQDGAVTIDELVAGVNVALGNSPVDLCPSMDGSGDGEVTIDELIAAVGNALSGCLTIPTPAPTQPPTPMSLFVRASGSDNNDGSDAAHALLTISKAIQRAHNNYRIVVGPGTYRESVSTPSRSGAPRPLMFVADASGAETGDAPATVIVDATGTAGGAGFKLTNSSGSLIDGFTIAGAVDGAIIIRTGSDDVTVRNCVVSNNPGTGIRVQDSARVLLLNNLVSGSGGAAIALVGQTSGSPDARVLSNTLVGNGDRGLTVGSTQVASPGALLRNNIVQDNGLHSNPLLQNIKVFTAPPSDLGYDANFNLIFPPNYFPATLGGPNDLVTDAAFVAANSGDYHLRPDSPAVDAGEALPPEFEALLAGRTTTGTAVDSGAPDLGFHFLP